MKTCPNCKELVGDNVENCFNCHYNFKLKKVMSSDELKQKRALQEEKIKEVTEKSQQYNDYASNKDEILKNMILSTTNTIDGYKIERYVDIVSVDSMSGIGLNTSFKSLGNAFSAFTGSEVSAYTERLSELKREIKNTLKYKAYAIGANAIVGIDYETTILDNSMIMISISGTAVNISQVK